MKRNVWTPKPSIMRKLRGIARSDMTHMIMCIDSGISEMKSQNVSCAEAACGISLSGSGFTAWTRSGNLIASWMKKTGMLLPTRSKMPSSRVELDREAADVARHVGRAARAGDRREADEDRRPHARVLEEAAPSCSAARVS